MSEDIRDVVRVYMNVARRRANEQREDRHGPDREILLMEKMFLAGIQFAGAYTHRDAFTAAQNELNFLFGRYQERT